MQSCQTRTFDPGPAPRAERAPSECDEGSAFTPLTTRYDIPVRAGGGGARGGLIFGRGRARGPRVAAGRGVCGGRPGRRRRGGGRAHPAAARLHDHPRARPRARRYRGGAGRARRAPPPRSQLHGRRRGGAGPARRALPQLARRQRRRRARLHRRQPAGAARDDGGFPAAAGRGRQAGGLRRRAGRRRHGGSAV
ncbi:MAG: hypothetical protein J3K34DRAFT_459050, partial [Monoraphidium minutum]